jgi:hypothetical protein
MKELFEQLRDLMPQERGSKASKWEILTKGKETIRSVGREPRDGLTDASNCGAPTPI